MIEQVAVAAPECVSCMPSFSSALVRIVIVVAILAADGRGLPQVLRADDGVGTPGTAVLVVVADGCSAVSCCGAGSDCCCCGFLSDELSAESAVSCCGGGMDQAALAEEDSTRGCRCSFSPVSEGPRVPLVPPQTAEIEAVGAVAVMPVVGTDGVLPQAGSAGCPCDARDPQPDPLLRHLAALCCWRT